jgi:hypothetical protein
VPAKVLAKREHPAPETAPPTAVSIESEELRAAARRQIQRVRRLTINVAAWAFGTILFTTLWVLTEWQEHGALKSFGHEGEPGQWNPTLWALAVGIWGLVVGIMALRVHFERPATAAEVDRELERLRSGGWPCLSDRCRRFDRGTLSSPSTPTSRSSRGIERPKS